MIYAIGEIVLVVIGILIALNINNWHQEKTNRKLESRYIENMIIELTRDSIELASVHEELVRRDRTKYLLLDLLKNNQKDDSLKIYFRYQWPIRGYVPSRSTFTEMISNAHLGLVRQNSIREHIIEVYTNYEDFDNEEETQFQQGLFTHEALQKRVPNIMDPTIEDILNLRDDFYILNRMTLNGSRTRENYYKNMLRKIK